MLVHTPVNYLLLCGSRDGLLVGCRTCDQKVESLNPGRSGGRSFFSKNQPCVLTLYRCLFRPRYTGVAHKRPRSFCQKCRWHVTPINTHTPLTQQSRCGLTLPLSRHSVGTYPETSSHATCQGTFGHSRPSSLSHCGLILEWN